MIPAVCSKLLHSFIIAANYSYQHPYNIDVYYTIDNRNISEYSINEDLVMQQYSRCLGSAAAPAWLTNGGYSSGYV